MKTMMLSRNTADQGLGSRPLTFAEDQQRTPNTTSPRADWV